MRRRRDERRVRRLGLMAYLDGQAYPDAFYVDGRRGVVRVYERLFGYLVVDRATGGLRWQERRGRVTWARGWHGWTLSVENAEAIQSAAHQHRAEMEGQG